MTLPGLVELMRKNIPDEKWLLYFRGLEKFGNDEPEADGWTRYVIAAFDGTHVSVVPPQDGVGEVDLNQYQWVEFMAWEPFHVSASQMTSDARRVSPKVQA